jgi:outer membrane protein
MRRRCAARRAALTAAALLLLPPVSGRAADDGAPRAAANRGPRATATVNAREWAPGTPPAPPGEPSSPRLTLLDAVRHSLERYPSVGAARAGRTAARAAVGEALAARYPALRVEGSATRFEEPMVVSPFHGFTPGELPTFSETLVQGGLTARYTVFDGGGRGARVRAARSEARAADADLDAARQVLTARVTRAYLETLGARLVLEAHDRRLASLREEVSRARQRLEVGKAARVDVLRVEAAVARAEAERVATAERLGRSERDLARLCDLSPGDVSASRLEAVRLVTVASAARESLAVDALESSPSIAGSRHRVAAAEAGHSAARSAWWPEVSLVGRYLYYGDDQGDGVAEWQAGAALSYGLFTGWARQRAVDRTRAEGRRARESLRLSELAVREEVDRSLSTLAEARARVQSFEKALARFEEVVRIERLRRETGVGTEADYLEAEADRLEARAGLVEARHGEIAARVELARVTGRLDPAWLEHNLESMP